jgi:hypothetical protein
VGWHNYSAIEASLRFELGKVVERFALTALKENEMSNPDLSKVYTNLAAREKTPQVDIQAFKQIGQKAFKVVAATFGVDGEASFADAVVAMTDGQGRLVPGSFRQKGRICVATVIANAKSQPMDASFHQVTASTARDLNGNIWAVVDDGGNKRVVFESSDDLADILAARRAGCKVFAPAMEGAGIVTASMNNGDLIRYVDVSSGTTDWGLAFHTDTGITVVNNNLTPKIITADAVVASVPRASLPAEAKNTPIPALFETARLDAGKLNTVLDYLQKAWAKTPLANEMLDKYRKLAANAA